MNKRQTISVTITFLVLIFGFSIATLFVPQKSFSDRENRTLTTTPVPTVESILDGSFESSFEESLTDQFIFRDLWISAKTRISRLLGAKDIHDVYFADDGYLIEKHTDTFTSQTAEDNIAYLSSFIESLSKEYDSSHLSVMIIPNAVDILKDKLPAYAQPYDEEEYLQKISAALPEHVWFDSSSVLREHSDENIYYKTDHHWTSYAAFLTYQAWAKQKSLQVPEASDFKISILSDHFEGTIAAKVGNSGTYDTLEYYQPKSLYSYYLDYNRGGDIRTDLIDWSKLQTRDKYGAFFGGNYGLIEISKDITDSILKSRANAYEEILAGLKADRIIETAATLGEEKPENEKRKLLLIKDSYAHCFAPMLIAEFDEVAMVDLRYFNQSLSQYMSECDFTDVLVLCNAAGFAEDPSMARLLT